MKNTSINTIIIGAGQAGLSVSYFLTKKQIPHVILEKGNVGNSWRENRWDAFHLITPNHMTRLPGFPYKGKNPNGFDSKDEIIKHFEKYAHSFKAPIVENTEVEKVKKTKNGFIVKSNKETFEAKNVVVAIGSFHKTNIPNLSKSLPKNIFQIHSSEYKNPKQLPLGSVLIVGAGNSGLQIAVDLQKSGRKVFLSVGRLRIVPRTYRGKDFMEWAEIMGALDRTTDEATPEIKNTLAPLLFGYDETVNFRKLAKDGITLLGRLKNVNENVYSFDSSHIENIEKAETGFKNLKNVIDKLIIDKKIKAPKVKNEKEITYHIDAINKLDGKSEKINSIIWSTGFKDDYAWLDVHVFDKNGEPIHKKGVSKTKGLYFIGLRWLSKYKSFLLCGIAEDAEYITDKIEL